MSVTIHNVITAPGGPPAAGEKVVITAVGDVHGNVEVYTATGGLIGERVLTTDSMGAWSIALNPSSSLVPTGAVYKVEERNGRTKTVAYFRVPDAGGPYLLKDVLVDAPASVPSPGSMLLVDAEATAREAADASLAASLTAEAAARQNGDAAEAAARTAAITTAVNALVNGAPGALDTLKELADAFGGDANFAATVTNALATKATVTALTAETNRAQLAEATNATAIANEVTARQAADTAEIAARNAAITAAVNGLIGGAPGALDTLKELADALGDDASFAATVTNALAAKATITALTAETTRAQAAEVANATAITNEVAARQSAVTAEAAARDTAITNAINALVNGAPGALDTLKEIADAINDDANIAATLTTAIALKAAKDQGSATAGGGLQLRHDLAANWVSTNPVLTLAEVGVESDTLRRKTGDGATAWAALGYDGGARLIAPPPTGTTADQTALQARLDLAHLAGGGVIDATSPGTYLVTGLVVDSNVELMIGPATVIRLANGSNQNVIRSRGFETYVPGRLTTGLVGGVAVTVLATTALTAAIPSGTTIEVGDGYTAVTSALAAAGATSIAVAAFTPSNSIAAGAGVKSNPSFVGAPVNFALRGAGIIDGNAANNTTGMGVAIFGYRYTVDGPQIYNTKEVGFFSTGTTGATAAYPYGQVETRIGKLYVAQSQAAGFHYEGPHDGYCDWLIVRSCAGIGVEIADLDGGYCHSYGNLQGFVIMDGSVRWNHVQPENNVHDGLVVNGAPSQPSHIGRVTAYGNWTSGTAGATDYHVTINGYINIPDLLVLTTGTGSGFTMTTNADHSTIVGKVRGTGGAGGVTGAFISAAHIDVTLDVQQFTIGVVRDFNHNENSRIKARITQCATGFYENGGTVGGSTFEISYKSTSGADIPWALQTTPGRNNYRLLSYGNVAWTLNINGIVDDAHLNAGEVTNRRPPSSGVSLTSGTLYLTYLTAITNAALTTMKMQNGGTAAAATPTLVRMGVYSVAANGDLTLVASTANDTTLFSGTFTTVSKALSASWTPQPGQRYALALLIVSAAAMPTPYGNANLPAGEAFLEPRICAAVAGQADLPATIDHTTLTSSSRELYHRVA